MNHSTPDIPIEEYSYEELQEIHADVAEVEKRLEHALRILDGEDCVARDRLAEAYTAACYTETAARSCLTLKSAERTVE